jgi:hypothetical protein
MTSIRDLSSQHQMAIEAMKSQLIIVLVNRLGGTIEIPATEIDATGSLNLMMALDDKTRVFTFKVVNK